MCYGEKGMPETIGFILSTARTGTKTLAEGLAGDEITSSHQPPFSRLLTIASNYYLHGWLPRQVLDWLIMRVREPQILAVTTRHYLQVYALDYMPAKIISEKYSNVYVIHIIRDPRTFVPSYLNWMHTRVKSFIANKLVVGWHPSGMFVGEFAWNEWRQMGEFERVCWHWSYKNRLLEHLFGDDEQYMRVRFEDLFLASDTNTLRNVVAFLGISYRDRFSALVEQRKNRSQKTYCAPWSEWQPARQQTLLDICGAHMEHYGYI